MKCMIGLCSPLDPPKGEEGRKFPLISILRFCNFDSIECHEFYDFDSPPFKWWSNKKLGK